MTISIFNILIISGKREWLITGVITVLYLKALKPKALPRRARGRTGRSPVPSCSIQPNKKSLPAMLLRMNAERSCKAVEQTKPSLICVKLHRRTIRILRGFYPLDASFRTPDRSENPCANAQTPGHRKYGNRFYDLP